MDVSGCPALASVAAKFCCALNSTLAVPGEIPTTMSLVTVICAFPWLAGFAALVAVIFTFAGEGKSAGAV